MAGLYLGIVITGVEVLVALALVMALTWVAGVSVCTTARGRPQAPNGGGRNSNRRTPMAGAYLAIAIAGVNVLVAMTLVIALVKIRAWVQGPLFAAIASPAVAD
jgi:hypothetical protein